MKTWDWGWGAREVLLKEGEGLLRTLPYLPGELMASEEERGIFFGNTTAGMWHSPPTPVRNTDATPWATKNKRFPNISRTG